MRNLKRIIYIEKRIDTGSDKSKGTVSYVKMCFVIPYMASELQVVLLDDQLSAVTCSASKSKPSEGVLCLSSVSSLVFLLKALKSTTFVKATESYCFGFFF